MIRKTLMIIGAGIMQEPAIKIARSMGIKTLVTDFNPDAKGMQMADIPVVMSTKDIEGTVRVAREHSRYLKIDGVITVGTDASMTVAAVANALGLPGLKFEVAENATNKLKMRTAFKKYHVPSPKFYGVWDYEETYKKAKKIGFPLVIKPTDNMGARGVKKVEKEEELFAAFNEAKAASPSGEIIIEEYMSGPELSIDMLLWNSKPVIYGVADRIITREPYFIEMGHTLPSQLDKKVVEAAVEIMIKGAKALGIDSGAAKGDIKITETGPKIGEIAARLSGGFMSAYTFPYATDCSIIKAAIEISFGIKPTIKNFSPKRVAIERALVPNPGRIVSINGVSDALEVEGTKNIFFNVDVGDIIVSPKCNLDKAANIIAVGKDLQTAELSVKESINKINIEIGPPPEITDEQIRANAKTKLFSVCNVCKVCNGVACAGKMPGIGSIGIGNTFINNIEALKQIFLKQRVIHSKNNINTETKFLKHNLSFPVFPAPVTGMQTNLNLNMNEFEYAQYVIDGAKRSGTIAFVGDGADAKKYKLIFQAIARAKGWAIPIFKPRFNDDDLFVRIEEALKLGVKTIGIDIDAVMLATMQLKHKKTRVRNVKELACILKKYDVDFILKGILSVEDAEAAVEAGASSIVVSNHGGRTIDSLPATINVLPEICKAVKKYIPVLVDGGFRTGEDILKALAFGASGVLIGRPVIVYAVGGGIKGVEFYLNNLKSNLEKSMLLTGVSEISEISEKIIANL